jgi:hypothetical protein
VIRTSIERAQTFRRKTPMDAVDTTPKTEAEGASALPRNLILVASYLLVMALIAIGYK